MTRHATKWDVAIVGAGTSGAAAAYHCARLGLKTCCIEARPLSEAGAYWVNGVPGWCFDQAGIPRPTHPEDRTTSKRFHLVAGWGLAATSARTDSHLAVDMRYLVARLQKMAQDEGATFFDNTRVLGRSGRWLRTEKGTTYANWIVDAAGLNGPALVPRRALRREEICTAAQEVRGVTNRPLAEAFFRRHGVSPGDILCFSGVAGGFSIVNLCLEGDEISILTGSVPALGHASGQRLVDRFVDDHAAWVGARAFGGARALPMRRPDTCLCHENVMVLGDSACQIYATHGSGIGSGMIAARYLAETLVEHQDPWRYNLRWQREFGGLFTASALFAGFSTTMSGVEIARLINAGVIGEGSLSRAMQQAPPTPDPREIPQLLRAVRDAPRLMLRLLPALQRMGTAIWHYRWYPEHPREFRRWDQLLKSVLNEA